MRVVVAAPFDGHTSSYIVSALEASGHTVKRFPYREVAALLGVPAMGDQFVDACKDCDVAVVLKGELLPPAALERARKTCRVAIWNFDPRDGKQPWVLERAASCDHFFTIAKGLVPFYRGMEIDAHWLLEGCDPFNHQPLGKQDGQAVPVSFIGTVHEVPGREQWLRHVRGHFGPERVAIWGSYCPKSLKDVYRGRAQGDAEFCQAVSNTAVNLGADRNPEIDRSYGARLFRTLAAGGYLLTNSTQGIYQDFYGCVAVYRDTADCLEQIQWALDHPEACALVAKRGRDLVLKEHTFKHRMDALMKMVTT